ncbi:hypothetical protein AJ85_18160 [Alkalihalobacillus alcalophilus ATCC 27647 = CGMCC 1.3604]|uniref:Uncharacterized protein n=1 Tax=Alkalihalobacillus alcalophilus ATCC 27647 = CGMCC 1.3604 TaxID=1218173 RepID=A0A4S4K318_ALKAL|nr:hypothetical protein AJ85_18160 [Alkalihalobacillus alcalophilus ATCC 27647 = CGMCC 1.3604]
MSDKKKRKQKSGKNQESKHKTSGSANKKNTYH